MYSDLKSMLLVLNIDRIENKGIFYGTDDAYDSLEEFLEIYRERSVGLAQKRSVSLSEYMLSQYLEEGILLKCMGDEAVAEYFDEVDHRDDFVLGRVDGPIDPDMFYVSNRYLKRELPKEKLAKWYIELLKKNPVLMQTSIIFNDPRMNRFFSVEQLEVIASYKEKIKSNAFSFYNVFMKYLNHEIIEIPESRERLMLDYFSLHFDDNDPDVQIKIENLVTAIVNNINDASIYQKEFVLKFVAFDKCKKNNVVMPHINFVSLDFGIGGEHVDNTSIINVSCDQVKYADSIKKFFEVVESINHECEHYLQNLEANNKTNSYRTYVYIIDAVLSSYSSVDYDDNYFLREVEQEARKHGVLDTVSFMKKYYKKDSSFIDKIAKKKMENYSDFQSYEYHLDRNGMLESRSIINISALRDVVSKAPHLVSEYPLLNKIFNIDGSMKSVEEFALSYYDANLEERRIMSDALEYICSSPKLLSNISLEQFTSDKAKIGFVTMITDDFEKKKERVFLVNEKINDTNGDSLASYDRKKFLYGIADDCADSLLRDYNFLAKSLNSMELLMVQNGEPLSSIMSNYLNVSLNKLSSILSDNSSFYPETKTKLNNLVSTRGNNQELFGQKK
ncbi:MAG: hypothetical protein J6A52_07135 [Bacilli bacterium]|nr:hypothetical protein [Bacilli bacterium]